MKKQIEGQINLFDYIAEAISLFPQCNECWCSTCRHNAEGMAVPRDFAGMRKPCPSCNFCISQDKAEICEIDSYENGCKLRAEEEGIVDY